MRYLCNAFTPAMLTGCLDGPRGGAIVRFARMTEAEARILAAEAASAVGHAGTAEVLSARLGRVVACERRTLALAPGDEVIVAQLSGLRLPEGRVLTAEEISAAGLTFALAWVEP